ncbi:MAG: hypothetical protein NZ928_03735 [Endomicrobia bacterium]|nr:hypothetical protein [Endomicrobiia bacterium]MDW8056117.1 hypothetical protein [Elusimicrobiota bacterium]
MKKRNYIFVFLSVFFPAISFCIRIIPVVKTSILGGQYFLENESTSFGGNVNIFISPVVGFSEEHTLIPLFSFIYRGTKDVQELVGGGTLTQECLTLGPLGLKYVYKVSSSLKFKIKGTYKIEYLKETKDEEWQKGLFDYQKTNFGSEIEAKFSDRFLVRIGLDYYTMRYPNYQSLVSKPEYKISIDTTTYTEISKNVGRNVLDYDSIDSFVEGSFSLTKNLLVQVLYNISFKTFSEQHIVNIVGRFEDKLRVDTLHTLRLNSVFNFDRMTLSITDIVKFYDSNQNSYDVSFTKFTENSYDYIENILSPSINVYLGTKRPYICFSLWWDVGYKTYLTNLARDEVGNYADQKLSQQMNLLGLSCTYPVEKLLKGFSVKLATSYNIVSSNMKYERFYKYNYSCFNYFLGLTYEY